MPQITIFEQMRGAKCILPVLEIAYGLERLVCALSCSRLNVTECELGFSYYNLNCLCAVGSFRVFYILAQALLRVASAEFFGGFYPACDMFLNLVCLYNQLTTEAKLKREALKALLLKLRRLVRVLMLTLECAEWFRKL